MTVFCESIRTAQQTRQWKVEVAEAETGRSSHIFILQSGEVDKWLLGFFFSFWFSRTTTKTCNDINVTNRDNGKQG